MSQRIKILSQRIEGNAIIYELSVPMPTPEELAKIMLKQTTTYVTRGAFARPVEPEGLYAQALVSALEEAPELKGHDADCHCWACSR